MGTDRRIITNLIRIMVGVDGCGRRVKVDSFEVNIVDRWGTHNEYHP